MFVTTAKLSFCVAATGPDLRLIVGLNETVIWDDYPAAEPVNVEYDFDDSDPGDHVLSFEMRGKRPEHTQLDSDGEIVVDRCVIIRDIALDGIQLAHVITSVAQYHHNNNDTTEPVTQAFYGVMGCNGRVEMPFSTPIYLWLLENM